MASSSLGREGRYSRFGSSPASPLHDAQNWPTPEHQSSLHDASSTPPLLPNLLWAWLLFGAWPARSLFFSLSRPEAPACRFGVAGLPVIRNNSPSPLLSAFWCSASCEAVTARFAGPLFVTKSLNAIHVNSEVQRPDIGLNFTGYNIYIIFIV